IDHAAGIGTTAATAAGHPCTEGPARHGTTPPATTPDFHGQLGHAGRHREVISARRGEIVGVGVDGQCPHQQRKPGQAQTAEDVRQTHHCTRTSTIRWATLPSPMAQVPVLVSWKYCRVPAGPATGVLALQDRVARHPSSPVAVKVPEPGTAAATALQLPAPSTCATASWAPLSAARKARCDCSCKLTALAPATCNCAMVATISASTVMMKMARGNPTPRCRLSGYIANLHLLTDGGRF